MRQFFIVAYNPELHNAEQYKSQHILSIAEHFGYTDYSKIVFFDDAHRNIDAALELRVRAFQVDGKIGFQLNDLLGQTPRDAEDSDG